MKGRKAINGNKDEQRKAVLQRKQGHVWQVFSSPRNSKIQDSGSKFHVVETAGKCSCLSNGNCGAVQHEL